MTYVLIIIFILIILFVIGSVSNAFNETAKKTKSKLDDDVFPNEYEYSADLWTPHTPLKSLKHHGDIIIVKGNRRLPDYGDSKKHHGIWLPCMPGHRNNLKHENIQEKRELNFLIKFREIYEGNLPHDSKKEIITQLINENKDLPPYLLPHDWFLWELTEISGVSLEISKSLYFNGFRTTQDVKQATDKELLAIPGIAQKRLIQIKSYFSKT